MKAWSLICGKCQEPNIAFKRKLEQGEIIHESDIIQSYGHGPWLNGDPLDCRKCGEKLQFHILSNYVEIEYSNPNTH